MLARYPELRKLYIQHLARYGNVEAACAYINVRFAVMSEFRKAHPWFNDEIKEALTAHKTLIEETIHSRAIDGWLEPKFGKFGVQGYVRKYSDQLLIAYARRHIKDYREGDVQHTEVTGVVDHVHSVQAKELAPEQREALRLLLGEGTPEPEPEPKPKIIVEPAEANGLPANHLGQNGSASKNGTH